MTEEQRQRWEHWATTRQNLVNERLWEVILGVETGRVQQAEDEHRRACDLLLDRRPYCQVMAAAMPFLGEQASLITRRS